MSSIIGHSRYVIFSNKTEYNFILKAGAETTSEDNRSLDISYWCMYTQYTIIRYQKSMVFFFVSFSYVKHLFEDYLTKLPMPYAARR